MLFDRMLGLALCAILAVTPSTDAWAQAWTQPDGGYFVKVSGDYLFTTEEWSVDGDEQEIAADDPRITDVWFRDVSFYAYAEYGLTDRLTLVLAFPSRH